MCSFADWFSDLFDRMTDFVIAALLVSQIDKFLSLKPLETWYLKYWHIFSLNFKHLFIVLISTNLQ